MLTFAKQKRYGKGIDDPTHSNASAEAEVYAILPSNIPQPKRSGSVSSKHNTHKFKYTSNGDEVMCRRTLSHARQIKDGATDEKSFDAFAPLLRVHS